MSDLRTGHAWGRVPIGLAHALNTRFLNVIKPIADAGDKLGKSVDAYNQAIGSMETRLMPALRKLTDSVVVSEEPPTLEPIERNPRLPLDVGE